MAADQLFTGKVAQRLGNRGLLELSTKSRGYHLGGGWALHQVLAVLAGAVTRGGFECVGRFFAPVPRQGNAHDPVVEADVVGYPQARTVMNGHETIQCF